MTPQEQRRFVAAVPPPPRTTSFSLDGAPFGAHPAGPSCNAGQLPGPRRLNRSSAACAPVSLGILAGFVAKQDTSRSDLHGVQVPGVNTPAAGWQGWRDSKPWVKSRDPQCLPDWPGHWSSARPGPDFYHDRGFKFLPDCDISK